MLSFPKFSEIKFTKFIIHSIIVSFSLTFLTLFGKDLVGMALGHPIEKNINYISTILFVVWALFAIQNDKYRKEESESNK